MSNENHEIRVAESIERGEAFEKAARPLIQYLAENHHPHVTAIIHSTGGQLLEGMNGIKVMDYIKD